MPDEAPVRRRIAFLVFNVDGADGVVRSVLTLAGELARRHEVTVLSLYRRASGPAYDVPPGVQVRYLQRRAAPGRAGQPRTVQPLWPPNRAAAREVLDRRASLLTRGRSFPEMSLLTDLVLARALRNLDVDVLVSTRPSLHAAVARLAPRGVVTVGQDHLNYVSRLAESGTMGLIELAAHRGLDAFVVLTGADEEDYARHLAGTKTLVRRIPNALSWPVPPPVERNGSRTIVSVGRLVGRKGMGRLIRAFAPVARTHPGWTLDIYGTGRLQQRLEEIIERQGLQGRVCLRGHDSDMRGVMQRAAVFASASRAEGFPMVMLEAMSTGLPLVAMDCPRGPAELVDEQNGVLVANGDLPAFSAGLARVLEDADLRRAMGEGSRRRAEEYAVELVADRWDRLFEDLLVGN